MQVMRIFYTIDWEPKIPTLSIQGKKATTNTAWNVRSTLHERFHHLK